MLKVLIYETGLVSSTVPSEEVLLFQNFALSLRHGMLLLRLIEVGITSATETSHARVR